MTDFELSLDLDNYGLLDEFALLACQDYNFGNENAWFNAFRGGLYGFHSRIHGLVTHYDAIHAWIPILRTPSEIEHHLASVFFCMDSAIECLIFAINALGNTQNVDQFRDITKERELRKISPKDIFGNPNSLPPKKPLDGYSIYFTTTQKFWQSKQELLSIIIGQHDVSKHRETIFTGGKARQDAPPNFYTSLGIKNDPAIESLYWPMAEIILQKDPKSAHLGRKPQTPSDSVHLEDVAQEFCDFLEESGRKLLADAKDNLI